MGSNRDKFPSIKLSTIVNKKYIAVQLLGKGGYGVVYEVLPLNSPISKFACKAELSNVHDNLKAEWNLMKLLEENKSRHSLSAIENGNERNYNYLIMKLVGPSLSDLRRSNPKKKFSLFTTIICAIQCFDSLHELHKLGYIHRDVKPSNFAIGLINTPEEKLIHILDFGICRCIFSKQTIEDSKTVLRRPRMKVPFRGTTTYCSPNVHMRLEPGRHDDFWSLLYVLIEFHLSDLPWESKTKDEAKQLKENKIDELLAKCPKEFKFFRNHLLPLTYSKEPDYQKIRNLFCQMIISNNFTTKLPLDWQSNGEVESVFSKAKLLKTRRLGTKKEITLAEIIDLPKNQKLLTEKDFPLLEECGTVHTNSTSRSDDTIPDGKSKKVVTLVSSSVVSGNNTSIPQPIKKTKIKFLKKRKKK